MHTTGKRLTLFIRILTLSVFVSTCSIPYNSTLTSTGTSEIQNTTLETIDVSPVAIYNDAQNGTTLVTATVPIGALSHTDMEQRIASWINGDINISDSERLLDEITREPVTYGLLLQQPINMVIFAAYNLGFTIVEDDTGSNYLITIVGFEDSYGSRFTFPFHIGDLSDECLIINLNIWKGLQINHGENTLFEVHSPSSLLLRHDEVINHSITFWTFTSSRGATENDCINSVQRYYSSAANTLIALVDFLDSDDSTIEDSPPMLSRWMDSVPAYFDQEIPYTNNIHVHVGIGQTFP